MSLSRGPSANPTVSTGTPVPGRSWDGLVVIVATSFWDGTPLLERHLAAELTAFAPVLYVEPPTSMLSRFRNGEAARHRSAPGLRLVRPGLAVLSVRLPPLKDRPWAKAASLALLRRALRRAVARLGADRVSILAVTSLDPVLGCLDEDLSVYYAKDDYLAGAALVGLPTRALERYVSRLCSRAGLVVAVSPLLAESLSERAVSPLVIPNGCDITLFARTALPPSEQRTVAFVGHLSDRVDVDLIRAVADSGVRVILVGPAQETMTAGRFDALVDHSLVDWVGVVPHADLPDVLAGVTVCLLPYTDTAFNRASFPLKALEYLAAGRRVVSTDLPALRWLGTDLITFADGPGEFCEAVHRCLDTPLTDAEVRQRREFASRHTWEQRAEAFARATGLTAGAQRAP